MVDSVGNETGRNRRLIDSVAPVILFLVLNKFAGLGWAVGGASLWGVQAAIWRKRNGQDVGKFLPILVVYLLLRGLIGIITDSEAVYFGIGIGTKAAIGLGLIATVIFGSPFLYKFLPTLLPFKKETILDKVFFKIAGQMTVVLGLYQILTSVWDVWLYNQTSVDGYVLIRFLVGFPASFLTIWICILYMNWALKSASGFNGFVDLMDPELDKDESV